MVRAPPSRGRDDGNATSIVVFEESRGTESSTFVGRAIVRRCLLAIDDEGRLVQPHSYLMRYGGSHIQIFMGKDFPNICRLVLSRRDTIRMPDGEPANRFKAMDDWFAFVRD